MVEVVGKKAIFFVSLFCSNEDHLFEKYNGVVTTELLKLQKQC